MNSLLKPDWKATLVLDDPNLPQLVGLEDIQPSAMNVRLFIERESLDSLERTYRAWDDGRNPSVVLPDSAVLRYHGFDKPLELLAGHRRVQAAHNAGATATYARITRMDDEDAYRFIREANNYEVLTTVEKAYAVAEMDRMGFSTLTIRETLGNIGVYRYLRIGRLVNPDWFSDVEKLCDPSITVWDYASRHGTDHFRHCFEQWNRGAWDEDDCAREFKRAGIAKPPEPYQAGSIFSVDETGKILRFRGTLDLNTMAWNDIEEKVLAPLYDQIQRAMHVARTHQTFGVKRKHHYSAEYENENQEA